MQYLMKIECGVKQWDSDFFGFKVGEAFINNYNESDYFELIKVFTNNCFRLVYLYPENQSVVVALSNEGISVLDTKVTFFKSKEYFSKVSNDHCVESYYKNSQYEKIVSLAYSSGICSRFAIDKEFRNNEFIRLYKEWIDKSLLREIADDVLVYKLRNEIVGFVTYKISALSLHVGLIAVDQDCRGKGVGRSLMRCIENIARQKYLDDVFVATQEANTAACNFYSKCDYSAIKKTEVCHLWLK